MPREGLRFDEINEGDTAPELTSPPLTRTHFVKYAGASGDFNPIHHDELYAIRAGNDRVFAMGMFTAGILGHMLTDWVGDGNLRRYKIRFTNRVWPGDVVTCKGWITRKYEQDGERRIDAALTAENQRGEPVIAAEATARCL